MIKAIGFRVIVKPKKVEEVSAGGIILGIDKQLEEQAQVLGTIIDIGEDVAVAFRPKTPHWGLKVGDEVYYAKYAGKWILDPKTGEQVLVLNDEDIVARVEGSDADPSVVAA